MTSSGKRWTLVYAASAARQIRKLDRSALARVRHACDELARDPERGKPLQLSLRGLRSWRTGDFRIVYRIVRAEVQILVVAVGHRREVYALVERLLRRRR